MKKVFRITNEIFAILIFLSTCFITPLKTKAQTLGDLKNILIEKQNELENNKQEQALTEKQINEVSASINNIQSQIEQTYIDIENLNKQINELNKNIEKKDKEIKEIMNFVQVSNGNSAYLEYAFSATTFTDFIYRVAVAEQLAEYNEKLIKEYNDMIVENQNKQKQIEEKRTSLATKQENLQVEKQKLGEELESLSDTSLDIEDEIEYQKEIIELYKSKGCQDNEDISTCGRKTLPMGTSFYRPIVSGYVTSEWGPRAWGNGWHEGIDFSTTQDGVPVYSISTGMVATIFYKNSCGGNMVVVHHNINGKTYTSVYAHLRSVLVSDGQTVDRNTQIGVMGGDSSTWYYDSCSTGRHLHLTVANGLYGVDYNFMQMNYKYSINPRSVINIPNGIYNWFTDRLTAY